MNFIQRILNRPPNPDAACAKKTLQYSFDNKRLCFGITSLADDVAAEDWLTMPNLGLSNEDENRRVILGQLVDDGIAVCVANSVEIENCISKETLPDFPSLIIAVIPDFNPISAKAVP